MRFTTPRFIGHVLIVASLSIPPIAWGQNQSSSDSSLAQLARQLREQRASSGRSPVRSFTNDDFPPAGTPSSVAEQKSALTSSTGKAIDDATNGILDDGAQFRPVEAGGVTDITKPFLSIAWGTVVLDVMVSEDGEVKNIQVRRDVASLTEVAVHSVDSWTFHPAQYQGKPVPSRITVALTFTPLTFNVETVRISDFALTPLIHQDDEARIQSAYQPPEVTHATLPAFPLNATGPATVVLEAALDDAGKPQGTKVLRDVAPFTALAIQAVKDFRFLPATLNGASLNSSVVLAFIFSQPSIQNWP